MAIRPPAFISNKFSRETTYMDPMGLYCDQKIILELKHGDC